ncbi:hypothetical protein P154DRAFT_323165 [Amniculicola lignicola CBS 123094]|uniref:Uncharacterized protein n=1 Tax=Amniculicola lignicola CBS 123094 TaxID=1392246 RepID=A0A6A5WAK4_9PLEO|nr:hypothetical protein P154DRAFT_323165 [Amniculicola lignicola CBS 123094]
MLSSGLTTPTPLHAPSCSMVGVGGKNENGASGFHKQGNTMVKDYTASGTYRRDSWIETHDHQRPTVGRARGGCCADPDFTSSSGESPLSFLIATGPRSVNWRRAATPHTTSRIPRHEHQRGH